MQIDIQFVPSPLKPYLLSNRAVVVIDALRATSVMVHALSEGAIEIIPVATVEEAFQLKQPFPSGTTLFLPFPSSMSSGRETKNFLQQSSSSSTPLWTIIFP